MRTIDLVKEKEFTCEGRTFYRHDSLSFNRYRVLQRLSLMFGYSRTFVDFYQDIKKCYDLMQTAKNYADVAVTLNNMLHGVATLEDKDDPALQLCALFLNEKDEDVTEYDEAKMRDKIACWGRELDVTPFFYFAASMVEGWMPAYRLTTRNTSEAGEED